MSTNTKINNTTKFINEMIDRESLLDGQINGLDINTDDINYDELADYNTHVNQLITTNPIKEVNNTNNINHLNLNELMMAHDNTKSKVIRYLDSQGYKTADIARFMGIRYQHVRNTLIQPLKKAK